MFTKMGVRRGLQNLVRAEHIVQLRFIVVNFNSLLTTTLRGSKPVAPLQLHRSFRRNSRLLARHRAGGCYLGVSRTEVHFETVANRGGP